MKRSLAAATLAVSMLALAGCQTTKEAANMAVMGISFDFKETGGCNTNSPAIKVTNIPAGTKFLDFYMVDLDYTAYNHGGGTVAYTGSGDIPKMALKNFRGPCPPSVHRYEITVKALNEAQDTVLGKGSSVSNYPVN